jgi:hypothetical protein
MGRARTIAGMLRSLYFSISGYIDVPTPQQIEQIDKLKKRAGELLEKFRNFREKDIPELLKLLEGKIGLINLEVRRQ